MANSKGRCADEKGRETSMGSFVRSINQRLHTERDETKCLHEKWRYPEDSIA